MHTRPLCLVAPPSPNHARSPIINLLMIQDNISNHPYVADDRNHPTSTVLSMAKHKHEPSFLVEYQYKFIVNKVIYATMVSSYSYQPNAPYKNII
jgi:hypothetical protein